MARRRAGRDRAPANCVLLFSPEDVERQFSLSARSRLARHEIGAILKALRRMEKHKSGEVVATPGEIVREEKDQEFERDKTTDDTRVKTAVAWLEEATLLSRFSKGCSASRAHTLGPHSSRAFIARFLR